MATLTSWASSEAVRTSMQGNRSRDTKPELAVRSLVHRHGLRYRVNTRPIREIRRTADMVFRKERVAVFVDGCFWHGCPEHFKPPSTNVEYWSQKLANNQRRDREVNAALAEVGWVVFRAWEHEDAEETAARIVSTVVGRRDSSSGSRGEVKRAQRRKLVG